MELCGDLSLPSLSQVFQVFLKWTDGLKSGLSAEDTAYLKDSLTRMECTVLPTVQDRWVSLHPSYGLVCWCDDKKLKKQFMHLDGVDFLYFGELSNDDEEILCTKMSILMQTFGIPALSEVRYFCVCACVGVSVSVHARESFATCFEVIIELE